MVLSVLTLSSHTLFSQAFETPLLDAASRISHVLELLRETPDRRLLLRTTTSADTVVARLACKLNNLISPK